MHTSLKFQLTLLFFFSLFCIQLAAGSDTESFSNLSIKRILSTTADSADKDSSSSSDVDITSSFIDSELLDIVWCGDDNKIIFVLSSKGTVYQTTDAGKTWNKLRELFQKTGKKAVEEDEHVGDVGEMLQSPVDSKMIIFLGSAGINWITEDCGKNIRAINSGKPIKEFQFHPNQAKWVLASGYTTCDDFDDGEPCKIYKELYLSKDLGETWVFVADYVIQFAWGCQDGIFSYLVPEERIVISHLLDKKGNQRVAGWTERAEIVYSDDLFKTKTVVLERGNKFLINRDYFFAVQADDEDTQEVKLYVGNPMANEYELAPIELPSKKSKRKKKATELKEHSYTILDTSEGQIFLHINHEGERSKYGNIYTSDSTGRRFAMSIHNHVRSSDGQCDFEKVAGLEGIYLVNVYDDEMIAKLKNDVRGDEDISTSGQTSKPTGKARPFQTVSTASREKDKRMKELERYKISLVSFDKGGIWKPLKPPKVNSKGEDIECDKDDDCSLHLHSISSSKFGPFYSTENSMGIVIGVGNVGKYLSNKDDEVNTYLSRNGGLTWYEVLQGSHIYEVGDHGAIIVAAPDQEATKVIHYTWNEGLTWEKVEISKTPIQVTNIIIEPTNTAEHFIIYGRTASTSKDKDKVPKGVVISVDFASLHERTCRNPDKPNDPSSDYETWSPNGAISEDCLMGHQITYVRRKREAECFNNEEWDRWYSYKNCECTEEDWECDIGYERKKDGPCQSITNETVSFDPPEECNEDYYYVTKGYRKVSGNTCEGGVDHAPIRLPCPGKGITTSRIFMLLALGGVITAIVIFSNKSYSSRAQKFAHNLGEKAKATTNTSFSKLGFKKLGENQEPNSLNEEDDEFDGRIFDAQDEPAQPLDNKNLLDMVQKGKKMAGRSGLDTAQKSIPMISKPGAGGSGRELMDM